MRGMRRGKRDRRGYRGRGARGGLQRPVRRPGRGMAAPAGFVRALNGANKIVMRPRHGMPASASLRTTPRRLVQRQAAKVAEKARAGPSPAATSGLRRRPSRGGPGGVTAGWVTLRWKGGRAMRWMRRGKQRLRGGEDHRPRPARPRRAGRPTDTVQRPGRGMPTPWHLDSPTTAPRRHVAAAAEKVAGGGRRGADRQNGKPSRGQVVW